MPLNKVSRLRRNVDQNRRRFCNFCIPSNLKVCVTSKWKKTEQPSRNTEPFHFTAVSLFESQTECMHGLNFIIVSFAVRVEAHDVFTGRSSDTLSFPDTYLSSQSVWYAASLPHVAGRVQPPQSPPMKHACGNKDLLMEWMWLNVTDQMWNPLTHVNQKQNKTKQNRREKLIEFCRKSSG